MLTEIFGERLKHWRLKRGMTQKELADKMGITYWQISHYESGRRNPSLYTVERFLTALDVSIVDFFGEEI